MLTQWFLFIFFLNVTPYLFAEEAVNTQQDFETCFENVRYLADKHAALEEDSFYRSQMALGDSIPISITTGSTIGTGAIAGATLYGMQEKGARTQLSSKQLKKIFDLAEHKYLISQMEFFNKVTALTGSKDLKSFHLRNLFINPESISNNKTSSSETHPIVKEVEEKMKAKGKVLSEADRIELKKSSFQLGQLFEASQNAKFNLEYRGSKRLPVQTVNLQNGKLEIRNPRDEFKVEGAKQYDRQVKLRTQSARLKGGLRGAVAGGLFGLAVFTFNCKGKLNSALSHYFAGNLMEGCLLKENAAAEMANLNDKETEKLCQKNPEVLSMLLDSYRKVSERFKGVMQVKDISDISCIGNTASATYVLNDGTSIFIQSEQTASGIRNDIHYNFGFNKSALIKYKLDPDHDKRAILSHNGLLSSSLTGEINSNNLKQMYFTRKKPLSKDPYVQGHYYAGAALIIADTYSESLFDACQNKKIILPIGPGNKSIN